MKADAVAVPVAPVKEPSEATRYLCAGAYLDGGFRSKVIDRVINERFKAVAPWVGVDLVSVVGHCVAAAKRAMRVHVILVVVLVVALVVAGVTGTLAPLLGGWLAAAVVVFVDQWDIRHRILARRLRRDKFDGRGVIEPAALSAKLQNIQHSNVIVYSGFVPFVSSGRGVGGWSFAVNCTEGKEELGTVSEPRPFAIRDLYDSVSESIHELGIEGLTIEDRLYVDGRDIRNDRRFLADPFKGPTTRVEGPIIESLAEATTNTVRHYRQIRIMSWDGQLVLSIFFRAARKGTGLFVEADFFLLTPVKDSYGAVDGYTEKPTLRQNATLAAGCAALAPFALIGAPFAIYGEMQRRSKAKSSQREERRLIAENPMYDFGAGASVRVESSSDDFTRYFQKLDRDMYVKILNRELLEAICRFLDEHDISTAELKERSRVIANNGIIISGGEIKAEQLTIGDRARAALQKFTGGGEKAQPKAEMSGLVAAG